MSTISSLALVYTVSDIIYIYQCVSLMVMMSYCLHSQYCKNSSPTLASISAVHLPCISVTQELPASQYSLFITVS